MKIDTQQQNNAQPNTNPNNLMGRSNPHVEHHNYINQYNQIWNTYLYEFLGYGNINTPCQTNHDSIQCHCNTNACPVNLFTQLMLRIIFKSTRQPGGRGCGVWAGGGGGGW